MFYNPGIRKLIALRLNFDKKKRSSSDELLKNDYLKTEAKLREETKFEDIHIIRRLYSEREEYVGESNKDKKHDKEYYFYADGDMYKGEWINNKKKGKGIFRYTDGIKYEGEWVNNKRHGTGVFHYSNGDKYEEKQKNDKSIGIGVIHYSNGKKEDIDGKILKEKNDCLIL